jgi:hypothetical protein
VHLWGGGEKRGVGKGETMGVKTVLLCLFEISADEFKIKKVSAKEMIISEHKTYLGRD